MVARERLPRLAFTHGRMGRGFLLARFEAQAGEGLELDFLVVLPAKAGTPFPP